MAKVKAGPVDGMRLKSFVERIERLEEERKAIGGDVKDVYAEAKGVGYDVKTMRQIVKERAQDSADRDEQEALLEVYRHALGMGTYRSVAAQYGISKSKLHRLVPREENGTSAPKPEDGDDGITESCSPEIDASDSAAPEPVVPTGNEGSPGERDTPNGNEAPAPPSVGAVASESERVAPQTDLEMPSIPSFLDRRTAQGRGA